MRMIMFTVLILEDDYEQQKAVSKIINEHYKDWQIFIAGTYKEACNLTSTKCFDLFLLDIELKHENENDLDCDGLDFGKYIRSIEHYLYTPIVYMTALPDRIFFALQEIHCSSYLVKPFTSYKLIETLDYIIGEHRENKKEKITLKDSNGVYLHLQLDDIDYIESTSKETVVYTHDANIKLTNMTINELLDIFPDNFIQCHRKYIVNLHHFYSYDKSTFIIQVGKHSIPLGRKHKKDIEKRLHLI